jgi:hypothetical protein
MNSFRRHLYLVLPAAFALLVPAVAVAHSLREEANMAASYNALRELVEPVQGPGDSDPADDGFKLVGHDPLNARGMNAAPAMHGNGNYVYVGSRTDGQPQHRTPGILVVDVSNPRKPKVVHEIGPPDAALPGETSRELRVWPQQKLLIVMNFGCSSLIHACVGGDVTEPRYTFFDISGEHAAKPKLVSTYVPSRIPHEMFLWVDPNQPKQRALLFQTTPTSSQTQPNLIVTDISKARQGKFTETPWVATFDAGTFENGEEEDRRLHSIGVSNDGTRTYLAFLGSGFLVLDTSEVIAGEDDPNISLVTPPENRVSWSNPGAHSAVKVYGRDVALVTDEVYGDALDALGPHGCPWGWVRMIDIQNPSAPRVMSEYRVEQNHPEYCESEDGSDPGNTTFTSYSSHNPTITRDLAFVTWHSAGLEAIDIANAAAPTRAGKFVPEPLESVATEDPALSLGRSKVVMWSYPIISDGLIYVVDLRNGLYILRYTGPRARQIAPIDFLEGNSNLGDALRLEPVR